MPKLTKAVPKYRKHRASGQAVVSIGGVDRYLGPHGTKASRIEYDRLITEWLANGRQLLPTDKLGSVKIKLGRARLPHQPPLLPRKAQVVLDSCRRLLVALLMQLCLSGAHARDATADATSGQTASSHDFARLDPLDSRRCRLDAEGYEKSRAPEPGC